MCIDNTGTDIFLSYKIDKSGAGQFAQSMIFNLVNRWPLGPFSNITVLTFAIVLLSTLSNGDVEISLTNLITCVMIWNFYCSEVWILKKSVLLYALSTYGRPS